MGITNIHAGGMAKFVVLKDKQGELHLKSDSNARLHRDIVELYSVETDKHYECLGGGILHIEDDNILAFGISYEYGHAPKKVVEELLLPIANGKSVKVNLLDY